MKQVSLFSPIHQVLASPLGPDNHLNIGSWIIRYEMDYFTHWYGRQQIV